MGLDVKGGGGSRSGLLVKALGCKRACEATEVLGIRAEGSGFRKSHGCCRRSGCGFAEMAGCCESGCAGSCHSFLISWAHEGIRLRS